MKQISILGCGWLGLPLAKSLIQKGFSINGSTTSIDKITELNNTGMKAFLIDVRENYIKGEIELFLEKSEILIIDIPPNLRGKSEDNSNSFIKKMEHLISEIEKSDVKKVIFVSSTSVYGDSQNRVELTEETIPNPETESGKQLVAVEQLLQNNTHFQTTIIRFGGLIGEDRNPIKFLAGRKNIENPDAPINLIHQLDCIGIIEAILKQHFDKLNISVQNDKFKWNQVFNAVAPFHPTRKEYYTQKAIALNLPLPEFDKQNNSKGKTISSNKVEMVLGYNFKKLEF
jgi:nucleoside-diphosphate-sugar epimerase